MMNNTSNIPKNYWDEDVYVSYGTKVDEIDRTKIVKVRMMDDECEEDTEPSNGTSPGSSTSNGISCYAFNGCINLSSIEFSKTKSMMESIGVYTVFDTVLN